MQPYSIVLLRLAATVAVAAFVMLSLRLRAAHADTRKEAALATARADRLTAIINTTVDGIIVITDRGLIESFNPAAERLFGYAAQEVIGKNISMLMPSPYHEEHDGYLSRYSSTGKPKIIGIGRQVSGQRTGHHQRRAQVYRHPA